MTTDRRAAIAILAGLAGPPALCAIVAPFRHHFANTDAALVLVALVVAVAALGNRIGGTLAALSAGLWFDYFLTDPYGHLSITARSDLETTVLLLAVGVGVTELAVWGRRQHAQAIKQAGYLSGLHAAAEASAAGGSPTELAERVGQQLTAILNLKACRFHFGTGQGNPRLEHDGSVTWCGNVVDVEHQGLPADQEVELLVSASGQFWGRYLMTPTLGSRPDRAQRQVAVSLADQVGAALGSYRPVRG